MWYTIFHKYHGEQDDSNGSNINDDNDNDNNNDRIYAWSEQFSQGHPIIDDVLAFSGIIRRHVPIPTFSYLPLAILTRPSYLVASPPQLPQMSP